MRARVRTGPLRVRLVGHDVGRGGAARATARLADALAADAETLGLEVTLRTVAGPTHPLGGAAPYPGGPARLRRLASSIRRRALDRLPWTPATSELHSRADVWTGLGWELNRAAIDVLNLHWVGTGTLSIEEIGRLRHPVVLTLHDMWAFTGAEHVTYDERFTSGYRRGTRPGGEAGVDWNRHVWRRKARAWRRPMHVVTPSRWLAEQARKSALMQDWPVRVIPNPLDTSFWRPTDRGSARSQLGLPDEGALILFGADGGMRRHTKGGDLLEGALHHLPDRLVAQGAPAGAELVVYGGERATTEPAGRLPFRIHHLGPITDDHRLRQAYAASDVMVVPSRIDNLPNAAVEAQACGVPVVGFDVGGLRDIVEDGVTGRLSPALDVRALADAVAWTLSDSTRCRTAGAAARARAVATFASDRIAADYRTAYLEASQLRP